MNIKTGHCLKLLRGLGLEDCCNLINFERFMVNYCQATIARTSLGQKITIRASKVSYSAGGR